MSIKTWMGTVGALATTGLVLAACSSGGGGATNTEPSQSGQPSGDVGGTSSGQNLQDTYSAGANFCLSGSAGTIGGEMREGVQLAIDTLNSEQSSYKLKAIFEDSAGDPQKGLTVFNDLAQNKKTPVVYSCGTAVISATLEAAARTHTVLIDVASGGPQLTGASPWLFSDYITSQREVQAMSDYMWNKLGYRSIAVDYRSDEYGTDTFAAFKKYWTKLGGKITVAVEHDTGSATQTTQVAKIRSVASKTDAVYLLTSDKDAGVAIKELRNNAVKLPIVGVGPTFTPGMLGVAGNAANGMIFSSPNYNLDDGSAITKAFNAAFKAKHGNDTPATYTVSSYDGIVLWNEVIQQIRKEGLPYNGDSIKKVLSSGTTFAGLGHEIHFDSEHVTPVPVRIAKVVDGKPQLITVVK